MFFFGGRGGGDTRSPLSGADFCTGASYPLLEMLGWDGIDAFNRALTVPLILYPGKGEAFLGGSSPSFRGFGFASGSW